MENTQNGFGSKGTVEGTESEPTSGRSTGVLCSPGELRSPRGRGGTLVVRAVGGELGSWPGKGLVIPTP